VAPCMHCNVLLIASVLMFAAVAAISCTSLHMYASWSPDMCQNLPDTRLDAQDTDTCPYPRCPLRSQSRMYLVRKTFGIRYWTRRYMSSVRVRATMVCVHVHVWRPCLSCASDHLVCDLIGARKCRSAPPSTGGHTSNGGGNSLHPQCKDEDMRCVPALPQLAERALPRG
jgi:hypothetical protein